MRKLSNDDECGHKRPQYLFRKNIANALCDFVHPLENQHAWGDTGEQ